MKYRAALVGCGKIGTEFADDPRVAGIYTHAGAYSACSNTELVAVCDADATKAARCGERWNVSAVYTDIDRLLEEQQPEIISVCTPDETHAEILITALQSAGLRAVLAEKPLALDMHQAQDVVQLAEERGVLLAVNYSRRYSTGHWQLREMIQSGGIGAIQKVSGLYTKGVRHNGSHWFDLARWLIGEVTAVQGFNPRSDLDRDPTLDVWLMFESKASGFLQGCSADAFSVFEMDIIGTQGRLRLIDSGHRVECFTVADSPYYSGYTALHKSHEQDGELDNTLLNAVADLVHCVAQAEQPRCSGQDGLAALRIASAAVTSAQDGTPHVLSTN